ncbi:MAG: hypothetical protein ABF854_13290, partial [Gluconacetobacter sp.]
RDPRTRSHAARHGGTGRTVALPRGGRRLKASSFSEEKEAKRLLSVLGYRIRPGKIRNAPKLSHL